jgi:hypothetical protein
MAETNESCNSVALATPEQKDEETVHASPRFGDFCFWPVPMSCLTCKIVPKRVRRAQYERVMEQVVQQVNETRSLFQVKNKEK